MNILYRNVYDDLSCGPVQSVFFTKAPTQSQWHEFSASCAEFNSIPGKIVIGAVRQ